MPVATEFDHYENLISKLESISEDIAVLSAETQEDADAELKELIRVQNNYVNEISVISNSKTARVYYIFVKKNGEDGVPVQNSKEYLTWGKVESLVDTVKNIIE